MILAQCAAVQLLTLMGLGFTLKSVSMRSSRFASFCFLKSCGLWQGQSKLKVL